MAENYKNESMVDVAYGVLKDFNKSTKFRDLYTEVSFRLEFTDEQKFENISKFYTDLTLDGRFVTLRDNEWDLRENHKFDKVNIDMNDVYSDIDLETKQNIDKEEYSKDELAAEGLVDEDEESDDNDYDNSSKNDL